MGGGSLMTPLLVIVSGFNPTVAIGTDIAHGAVFKTVGARTPPAAGDGACAPLGLDVLASAPMSLLGVWIATSLEHSYGDGAQSVMARALACALVAGSLG